MGTRRPARGTYFGDPARIEIGLSPNNAKAHSRFRRKVEYPQCLNKGL